MGDYYKILPVLQYLYNTDGVQKTIYDIKKKKASVGICHYVERLYTYLGLDTDVIEYAMYYLAMYVHNTLIKVGSNNIHRLFLTAVTVAYKFWEDDHFSNKYIAQVGGISNEELNSLERDFLFGVDWDLYRLRREIDNEDFSNIVQQITGVPYETLKKMSKK